MTPVTRTNPPGGRRTILVVEDAEPFRLLVRELLEEAGFEVLDAEGPDAALSQLEAAPRRIDLVLTDMVMPRMSGREFAKRLATLQPQVRVVFMSGYSDNSLGGVGELQRGAGFLQKPFTNEELMRTVLKAFEDTPEGTGGAG